MTKETDGAEDAREEAEVVEESEKVSTDKKSGLDANKPSPKTELTKEQEKMVEDRVAAILAKKGDKAKELEERLRVVETVNKEFQDEKFATVAARYGLEVEKLNEMGITEPAKIEAYASLFGKTAETGKFIQKADSGKTSGGSGELTPEMIANMSPDERFERRKEIAKIKIPF